MPDRTRDAESGTEQGERRIPKWLFYAPLLLLLAIIAVASFAPDQRLWGVNHLAFYPLSVRIGSLVVMILSFLPVAAGPIHAIVLRVLDVLATRDALRWLIIIVLSVVSVLVFMRFQSATLLLGDGRLIARTLEAAHEMELDDATPLYGRKAIRETNAPGAMLLYYGATKLTGEMIARTEAGRIRIINCLLGGIFVFVLLLVVLKAPLASALRMWLAILVLSSGSMTLFFGYVETYTPLLLSAFLYVVCAFKSIHSRKAAWIIITFLCLAAAAFTHIQGALLAPSFLLLFVWFVIARRRPAPLRPAALVIGNAIIVATVLAWAFTRYGEHFLAFGGSGDSYGVFSWTHLLDIFNELLLLFPLFFLIDVIGSAVLFQKSGAPGKAEGKERPLSGKPSEAMRTREGEPGTNAGEVGTKPGEPGTNAGEALTLEVEWYFALLLLVPSLLFLLVFEPEIGMARDWDLFTIVLVGTLPASLLVLNRVIKTEAASSIARFTVPAAVMGVILACAWIGINADSARSTQRFEKILEYDKTNQPYSYEILAEHYYGERDIGKAIAALEMAVADSRNPRQLVLLGEYYEEDGRVDDAVRLLRSVLEKDPQHETALHNLVIYLNRARRYDELFDAARDGARLHPDKPIFRYYYGMLLIQRDQVEEGVAELLECKRLGAPQRVLKRVEQALNDLEAKGKY